MAERCDSVQRMGPDSIQCIRPAGHGGKCLEPTFKSLEDAELRIQMLEEMLFKQIFLVSAEKVAREEAMARYSELHAWLIVKYPEEWGILQEVDEEIKAEMAKPKLSLVPAEPMEPEWGPSPIEAIMRQQLRQRSGTTTSEEDKESNE